jgi:hypothetical protein
MCNTYGNAKLLTAKVRIWCKWGDLPSTIKIRVVRDSSYGHELQFELQWRIMIQVWVRFRISHFYIWQIFVRPPPPLPQGKPVRWVKCLRLWGVRVGLRVRLSMNACFCVMINIIQCTCMYDDIHHRFKDDRMMIYIIQMKRTYWVIWVPWPLASEELLEIDRNYLLVSF